MIIAADLFCGAGGTSTGLVQAGEILGKQTRLTAVNHWPVAVETHTANHPEARHYCCSIDDINPRTLFAENELDVLWASPECTHHSIARGGRPINDQSRATAWCVVRWAEALRPGIILIENVPEFLNWGGIGADGRPLKSKKGDTFRAWVAALESLGYRVGSKLLCAADYGDPTTRKRLFIQAVRGKRKLVWPDPTHGKNEGELLSSKPWVAAREVIDWSLPSQSIYERKKPLAEKTLARIMAGLEKYGLREFMVPNFGERPSQEPRTHDVDSPLPSVTSHGAGGLVEPFIVEWDNQSSSGGYHSIERPLSTVVTKARHGIAQPFIVQFMGDSAGRSLDDPLSTVRTSGKHHALCEPMLLPQQSGGRARPVSEPAPTVACAGAVSLIQPFLTSYYGSGEALSVENPLGTVTTKQRFGLAQPEVVIDGNRYRLDIRFRMLQPHELALAQGFMPDHQFTGNKTEIVKQIGNAVPRRLARAICLAALAQTNDIAPLLKGKNAA